MSAAEKSKGIAAIHLATEKKSLKKGKAKSEDVVSKFQGEGLLFKAKFYGTADVANSRGDGMCQEALLKLKSAVKANGEHKQKILFKINLNGITLVDSASNYVLHEHPVSRIAFISKDQTDSRSFAYVVGSPNEQHRLFGIKTDKSIKQKQTVEKRLSTQSDGSSSRSNSILSSSPSMDRSEAPKSPSIADGRAEVIGDTDSNLSIPAYASIANPKSNTLNIMVQQNQNSQSVTSEDPTNQDFTSKTADSQVQHGQQEPVTQEALNDSNLNTNDPVSPAKDSDPWNQDKFDSSNSRDESTVWNSNPFNDVFNADTQFEDSTFVADFGGFPTNTVKTPNIEQTGEENVSSVRFSSHHSPFFDEETDDPFSSAVHTNSSGNAVQQHTDPFAEDHNTFKPFLSTEINDFESAISFHEKNLLNESDPFTDEQQVDSCPNSALAVNRSEASENDPSISPRHDQMEYFNPTNSCKQAFEENPFTGKAASFAETDHCDPFADFNDQHNKDLANSPTNQDDVFTKISAETTFEQSNPFNDSFNPFASNSDLFSDNPFSANPSFHESGIWGSEPSKTFSVVDKSPWETQDSLTADTVDSTLLETKDGFDFSLQAEYPDQALKHDFERFDFAVQDSQISGDAAEFHTSEGASMSLPANNEHEQNVKSSNTALSSEDDEPSHSFNSELKSFRLSDIDANMIYSDLSVNAGLAKVESLASLSSSEIMLHSTDSLKSNESLDIQPPSCPAPTLPSDVLEKVKLDISAEQKPALPPAVPARKPSLPPVPDRPRRSASMLNDTKTEAITTNFEAPYLENEQNQQSLPPPSLPPPALPPPKIPTRTLQTQISSEPPKIPIRRLVS